MIIKLHGTRGSYPTSNENHTRYGRNTPCIEVINGNKHIIVDAGTGILGIDFKAAYHHRIDILLTHLHMDHIQGLAYCKSLFNPDMEIHIWGPGGSYESLTAKLNRFLSPPLFPVPLRDIPSKLEIHELPNLEFTLNDFNISAEYICHPGSTVGFRIRCGDKTVAYLPDHETIIGRPCLFPEDEWVSGFNLAFQADLLIHDSQYSKEEYKNKIGWGHSSMEMAAELCSRTKAKRLILFHHNPDHSDQETTEIFEDFMGRCNPEFPVELAVQGEEILV